MSDARQLLLAKIQRIVQEFDIQYGDTGTESENNPSFLTNNIANLRSYRDTISCFQESNDYFRKYQSQNDKIIKTLRDIRSGRFDPLFSNHIENPINELSNPNGNLHDFIPPSHQLIIREEPKPNYPPSSQLILNFPKFSEIDNEVEILNSNSDDNFTQTQEIQQVKKLAHFRPTRPKQELSLKNVLNASDSNDSNNQLKTEANKPVVKRISSPFSLSQKVHQERSDPPISLSQPPAKLKKIPTFLELYPPDPNEPLPPPLFLKPAISESIEAIENSTNQTQNNELISHSVSDNDEKNNSEIKQTNEETKTISHNENNKSELNDNPFLTHQSLDSGSRVNPFQFTPSIEVKVNPFKSNIFKEYRSNSVTEITVNPFRNNQLTNNSNQSNDNQINPFQIKRNDSDKPPKPKFNLFVKSNINQNPTFNICFKTPDNNPFKIITNNQQNQNENDKEASPVNSNVIHNNSNLSNWNKRIELSPSNPFIVHHNCSTDDSANQQSQFSNAKPSLKFNQNVTFEQLSEEIDNNGQSTISNLKLMSHPSKSNLLNSPFNSQPAANSHPFSNQSKSPTFSPVITSPFGPHFLSSGESEQFVLTSPNSSQSANSNHESTEPLQPQDIINKSQEVPSEISNSNPEEDEYSDSIIDMDDAENELNSPIITVPADLQQSNSPKNNQEQEITDKDQAKAQQILTVKELESDSSSDLELSQLSQTLKPSGFIYHDDPMEQMKKAFGSSENPYAKLNAITRLPISEMCENSKK